MVCPKCGSNEIVTQMVTDTQLVRAGHSLVWWVFVGWWWTFIKWFYFFWLALLVKLFAPKRQKLRQEHTAVCICQHCGYHGAPEEFTPQAAPVSPVSPANPNARSDFRAKNPKRRCERIEVVGESYYKTGIASLGHLDPDYHRPASRLYPDYDEGDTIDKYSFSNAPAELVPEPDNPHDPNAIRVDVRGVTVGYIARTETSHVRELMEEADEVIASIGAGPYKRVIEDDDGDLTTRVVDIDFSVKLLFYMEPEPSAEPDPAPPRVDAQVVETDTERSKTALALFTICVIGLGVSVSVIFMLLFTSVLSPEVFLPALAGVVLFGALSWMLAGAVD